MAGLAGVAYGVRNRRMAANDEAATVPAPGSPRG
jgi:hypothetical protein